MQEKTKMLPGHGETVDRHSKCIIDLQLSIQWKACGPTFYERQDLVLSQQPITDAISLPTYMRTVILSDHNVRSLSHGQPHAAYIDSHLQ